MAFIPGENNRVQIAWGKTSDNTQVFVEKNDNIGLFTHMTGENWCVTSVIHIHETKKKSLIFFRRINATCLIDGE